MKRLAVVLTIVALAICVANAVYATPINLSENWYVKITNFTLQGQTIPDGWYDPNPRPINLVGFSDFCDYQGSTTALIEPKLQNPSSDGKTYSTLLFDFHAGQASTSDYAWYWPFATVGTEWTATMSFDWQIYCTNPNIYFSLNHDSPTYGFWSVPLGSGNRSGSVSLIVGTSGRIAPSFSVATVPEPTSLLAVTIFTVGFICRRRRIH